MRGLGPGAWGGAFPQFLARALPRARGRPPYGAAVSAAFALGRIKFWGSTTLATGLFLTYLLPDSLRFIPLFKIMAWVHETTGVALLNHWWALIIIYPTLTVPFCTWIMIGYFQSIPKELDEAALIDGAGYIQMLTKIFLPVALPGIIAATIFAFTVSWSEFLYPMAFTVSADQLVLPVGIVTTLIKGDVYNWGQIMAACLLGAAPPPLLELGTRAAFQIPQPVVQTMTTNVPGPQFPLYLAGRRMLQAHPYAPIGDNVRIAIAIFSYHGQLSFGITADSSAAPGIDILARGIRSGPTRSITCASCSRDSARFMATVRSATTRRSSAAWRGFTAGR